MALHLRVEVMPGKLCRALRQCRGWMGRAWRVYPGAQVPSNARPTISTDLSRWSPSSATSCRCPRGGTTCAAIGNG